MNTSYRTREYTLALMAAAELFASRHWVYGIVADEHVPDVEELAETVDSLVRAIANGHEMVQSGRFLVMSDGLGGVDIFVQIGRTS